MRCGCPNSRNHIDRSFSCTEIFVSQKVVAESCLPIGRENYILDETSPHESNRLMQTDRRQDIEDMVSRIALGNRDAFSQLYDATSGKLFAVCLRVLNERAAAEDAMQDAYVKVWKNADRYQSTGHSPMTWLITIARNTAIDRLRMRKTESDIADFNERIAAPGPSPEQSSVAASETKRIIQCLDELETDRRAAITGAYLQGKTYQDLSNQFDVPLNTMRTWLRRGLAALRECLLR